LTVIEKIGQFPESGNKQNKPTFVQR